MTIALTEVYKRSLLDEDDKLEEKVYQLLDDYDFTANERSILSEELKDINSRFKQEHYVCYIDGAVDTQSEKVRAGASFVIYLNDDMFYKYKYKIPEEHQIKDFSQKTSSHIAEYQALVILLRTMRGRVLTPENTTLHIKTDSEVLYGQYYGEFRVSNDIQKSLRSEVFKLAKHFKSIDLEWIPREENKIANRLAQEMIGGE